MQLSGKVQPVTLWFLQQLEPMIGRIEQQLADLPTGNVREAATRMYNNLSAVAGTVIKLGQMKGPCSSQAMSVLLRTLIESCVSVFALCVNPQARAALYLQHRTVIRFKLLCASRTHLGCPMYPLSDNAGDHINEALKGLHQTLRDCGGQFLRGNPKNPGKALEKALDPGNESPRNFRDRWYPETRRKILESEGLLYLDAMHYAWFSSSVHSDALAGDAIGNLTRDTVVIYAVLLWGTALYRFVESLGFRLSAMHKGLLRKQFYGVLHWPAGSPPRQLDQLIAQREVLCKELGKSGGPC